MARGLDVPTPRWPFVASAAGLLAACQPQYPTCSQPESAVVADGDGLRVVSFNIGNLERDGVYSLRLKDQRYEDFLGERIREIDADIVALQEVLAPTACATIDETHPEHTCFDWQHRPSQIERLLGSSYTIACDANRHVECVGVHERLGTIEGMTGSFGLNGALTAPLPHEACDFLAGECVNWAANCDAESSISTIVVHTRFGPLRIVHVHPTSTGDECRQDQSLQAFAFADALPTVLVGDWNFDPTDPKYLVEAAIWSRHVGIDRRFRHHMPYRGDCRLGLVDLVATDFAEGGCRVWNDPRLDEGYDFAGLIGERADHAAIECALDPNQLPLAHEDSP